MTLILILAAAPVGWLDRSSSEVARSVARLGDPDDVVTVGTTDLSAARWSHRIVDGRASTRIWLKNGTVIDTEAVGAVLNRMAAVPATGFASSTARDRAYADSEQQALFVSFLRSCGGRVINNVDGHGPLGTWSPLRWAALAHRCGIETWPDGIGAGTRLPSRRPSRPAAPAPTWQVTVVGQRVFGAVSSMQELRCLRLAEESECELLGLTFGAVAGGSRPDGQLLSADPLPPLSGDISEAVAHLLCDRATASSERAP
jgi:hypothetical protein